MERSELISRLKPYELATLASRIDPGRCMKDPNGALKAAVDLLCCAKHVLWCAVEENRRNEQEVEELAKVDEAKCVDWAKGVKQVTDEQRRDRATSKFTEFMKHESPGDLRGYKRDGFTPIEIHELEIKFAEWKKQPKGKQGRRISEHDRRLRVGPPLLFSRENHGSRIDKFSPIVAAQMCVSSAKIGIQG